jgi:transcriptional regulator with XRE-family HTH domain
MLFFFTLASLFDEHMNYIARNLRFLRNRRNLSQEALATQIGLNRGNIATYEKGSAEPNASRMLLICRFFEVPLADFIEKDFSTVPPEQYQALRQLSSAEQRELKGGLTQIRRIVEGLSELHILRNEGGEAGSIDGGELIYDYGRLLQASQRLLTITDTLWACLPALPERSNH